MARRKDGFTELVDVASKLPWKVSAALVPISFLTFHMLAVMFAPVPQATNLSALGTVVIRQGIHVGASIFQYIVPIGLFLGAVVSYIKRSRSISLFDEVRSDPKTSIANLAWQEFEALVGEGFRHRGFQVSERGGAGPDGGIDLVLMRGRERFLVQCKQWRARQVSVTVVRELYGVMAAEGVAGGYVVTSGTFTKDAKEFASGRNIELIDGNGLDALLRDGKSAARNVVELKPKAAAVAPPPINASHPTCPQCKSPMVMRVAKQGKNVGGSFWGCSQYPRCRQIVGIG